MPLAIFDLDNTLLDGDSDYLWGVFLADNGIVDRGHYERENERFYREYKEGRLDIQEFLRFSLAPLARHSPDELHRLRDRFLAEKIRPIILPEARALVQRHRDAGDRPLIVTATNRFVTAPIAAELGIADLIATEAAMRDGRYTGESDGVPSFREGKVIRLEQWLAAHDCDLAGSSFYSDSHNDMPLLERVDHPVAVDPDPQLAAAARRRGWPVLSLRGRA